jgi:pimeloyl-ACP methyl ester carboxylesterase/class 3 adenylate cyclase
VLSGSAGPPSTGRHFCMAKFGRCLPHSLPQTGNGNASFTRCGAVLFRLCFRQSVRETPMSSMPETRYAKSRDNYVAYQVMGEGPFDLVYVPGFVSHLEVLMEWPIYANFFRRLSSFCRLILFDKRGTGLSDRTGPIPTIEDRMDDVRAVMDAAGSERAALLGFSEGGPMSIVFAATYPQRTSSLLLCGAFARYTWAPDNVWGKTDEQQAAWLNTIEHEWGQGNLIVLSCPSVVDYQETRRILGRFERSSATPGAARTAMRMAYSIDVRHVLPTIGVPTLVLHRTGDVVNVEHGRYLAQNIRGAKYVEFPGRDHFPWVGDSNSLLGEIESFLTGQRRDVDSESDRVLATILFTDIVEATNRLVELGDRGWKELLTQHHSLVREQLVRHRGREIDTAGDGFLAAFDGPARAGRCGRAIVDSVRKLGIHVRAGVHTGECEVIDKKLGGIAVHIGARIRGMASPDEVLVSKTVTDLVAGSGLRFEERGTHSLKGVPSNWQLLAAT